MKKRIILDFRRNDKKVKASRNLVQLFIWRGGGRHSGHEYIIKLSKKLMES